MAALYDSSRAKLKYYGFESPLFNIGRGTCQGCPLSPLLFILALEPLAEAIHSHPEISGIEVAGSSHKITLFADILLTLTSPRISLPNLFSLLASFTSFSGLCVNPSKSKALSVNLPHSVLTNLTLSFPFQWLSSVPYLGIHLTPTYAGMFQANYQSLLKRLSDTLSSWSCLPVLAW